MSNRDLVKLLLSLVAGRYPDLSLEVLKHSAETAREAAWREVKEAEIAWKDAAKVAREVEAACEVWE